MVGQGAVGPLLELRAPVNPTVQRECILEPYLILSKTPFCEGPGD